MSKKLKVRRFNEYGIEIMQSIIKNKEDFNPAYLVDKDMTDPCINVEIDVDYNFNTNFELAKYLHIEISKYIDSDNEDAGMWTWLFFAYFKKLMREDSGKPNPLALKEHYIFKGEGFGPYRHLVYTWYMAYSRWGDKSLALMGTKKNPSQWGDFEEQFLSRRQLYQYYDLLAPLGQLITHTNGLKWTRIVKPKLAFSIKNFFYKKLKEYDGPRSNILTLKDCKKIAKNFNLNLDLSNKKLLIFKKN